MKPVFEKTYWETPFSCERDSLTIRGKAMIPKKQTADKLTPVIVSHGFMANMQTTAGYCRKLASWGFAAFCFDFAGGCIKGSSDGKTTEMSVFTEAEDLEAVIGYVSSLGNVDGSKLILMGCSQGGFVSAIVAARLKEKVARLILFYPALCIPDDARAGKMMMATFDPQNIPEIVNCGPMKLGRIYPASVIDKDPNELIQDYQGPVTIIHGDADPIVKLSYSESAMAAYQAHRDTKGLKLPHADAQLHVIRGAGHGFKGEEDKLAMEIVKQVLHNRFCALEVEVELT
ncbi:MAG: alpha/beta fold hydrolase, partial [Firmicutes bacterium]|nr:alpha/beta fold hydrolase [Bacillota bacterium]